MSKMDLGRLLHEWDEWARTADRSENGWESDYPAWTNLLESARHVMSSSDSLDEDTVAMLDRCWSLSEEDEELLGYAVTHIDRCWATIQELAGAAHPATRWQVYEAASHDAARGEPILRNGLRYPDPYARRRALIALARLRPQDGAQIAEKFLKDPDPYIRQASIDMVRASGDVDFMRRAASTLLADDSEHVRDAARALLNIG